MEPNAIPFEKKPRAVLGVFLVLFVVVVLLERMFFSDVLQPWKQACARAIQKRLPAFINIDGQCDATGVPPEVAAAGAIEETIASVESAASKADTDPEAAVRYFVRRETVGTMTTLVNGA